MTKRARSTGWVPVARLCTLVACMSVGMRFSVPIGGAGSIGVGVGSAGRVGGSMGVGMGGAGAAGGGSTTLPHAAAPAASAAP